LFTLAIATLLSFFSSLLLRLHPFFQATREIDSTTYSRIVLQQALFEVPFNVSAGTKYLISSMTNHTPVALCLSACVIVSNSGGSQADKVAAALPLVAQLGYHLAHFLPIEGRKRKRDDEYEAAALRAAAFRGIWLDANPKK
jgi:hypothetical protein